MGLSGQLDTGTQIDGGTDNTTIGNVGDRLKVETTGTVSISGNAGSSEVEYATFYVIADETATANNKSMISIVNTSGSTVVVRLRDIRIVNTLQTAVTGVVCDFYLYRCTTHSAGTSLTPASYDTADSLSSSVTVRTGATIGSEDTVKLRHWDWSTDEWSAGAPDVESADHVSQLLHTGLYIPSKTKPITLRANEGITLKCTTSTTTGIFDIHVLFTQES